jgi:hypothetical protein
MRNTLLACLAALALPTMAMAQPGPAINSVKTNARFFNDFSTTTLGIVNPGTVNLGLPSTITVAESGFTDDGMGGNFANRHDFTLSANGGANNATFSINDSFTVSAIVNLSAGSNAPRKEAGLRINSGATGDALFLVNSDAGEIVAFGGGGPFYSFSAGAPPDYTPGTSILMGFSMTGGGAPGVPNTIQYFIDRTPLDPAGVEYSAPLAFSNLEGGPVAYNVGMYVQATPNLQNTAEFVNTSFTDIRYSPAPIPEPAAITCAVIGFIGLGAFRRKLS